MKNVNVYLAVLLGSLALVWAPSAFAEEADEAAQQEIQQQENNIDQMAAAEGAEAVEQKIKDQFVVDESLINSLREKKFGYGEITTALSLAEHMDGGINEANIQTIVDLRSGETKKGWGEIAKQFNVSVGDLKKGLIASPQANDSPVQENIKAALDSSNKGGAKNKDILPVTKNLHDSPANKPAQVPRGK